MSARGTAVLSWTIVAAASWAACRRPEAPAGVPPLRVESAEEAVPALTSDAGSNQNTAVAVAQETAGPDDGETPQRLEVGEPATRAAAASTTCVWPPTDAQEATESVRVPAERLFEADEVLGDREAPIEDWAPWFRVFVFDPFWRGVLGGKAATGLLVVGGTGVPTVWSVPGPEPVLVGTIPNQTAVDGRLLADETTLRLFEAEGGVGDASLADLEWKSVPDEADEPDEAVYRQAASADGRREAYGGWDGVVRLDGEALPAHRGPTTALAFSDDGCLLASAGGDSVIRVWRASDGELLSALATPIPAASLRVSRDGSRIAAADPSGVTLWTLGRQEMSAPATPAPSAASASTAGPSGPRAECSSGSASAVVAENGTTLTTGRRTRRLDGYLQGPDEEHGGSESLSGDVTLAVFSPDCRRLAVSGLCRGESGVNPVVSPWCRREFVQLWSVETGVLEGKLEIPWSGMTDERKALAIAFTPDGEWVAVLSRRRWSDCSYGWSGLQLTIWNVSSGARILDEDVPASTGDAAVTRDGDTGRRVDNPDVFALAFTEDGAVEVTRTTTDGATDSFRVR